MAGDRVDTPQRRETTGSTVVRPPAVRPAETFDDFLADFAGTVAEAAQRKVNLGKAELRPGVAASGDVAGALKEQLKTAPERKATGDAASVKSSASTVRSLLRAGQPKNGAVEMSGTELAERAREKAERPPTLSRKIWNELRYNINSPLKIMLDNKTANGLGGGMQAPTFQGAEK